MARNACVCAKLNFVTLQKNHCLRRALNSAKPASLSWLTETSSAEYFTMKRLWDKKALRLFTHFPTWEFYGLAHKVKLLRGSCSFCSGIYTGFCAAVYCSVQYSQVTPASHGTPCTSGNFCRDTLGLCPPRTVYAGFQSAFTQRFFLQISLYLKCLSCWCETGRGKSTSQMANGL